MGAYTPGISSHIPIKQQVLSIKKTLSPPEAGDKELSSNPQHLPPTQESPPANQKPTRAVPATDFDAECVKKLRTIIAPATTAKYSSTAWKDEFRILRQTRTEQEIHSALEHYQKIFGREYTPQILSAKSFRLKFPQLVEAVKREEKRNPAVIVDPKLANCIARLKVLGWPKVASEKLPAACQISYDNFRAFQKKLDNPPPKDKHLADFLKYVRGHYLSGGGPVSFAEGWMRAAHGRVANWADWSGNVLALAFSEDSKEFRAEGHSIANKWGRGTDLWDRLMEELRDG